MAARSQARNWYQPRDLHCALLVASSVVMRSWKSLVGVPHEFAQHWCVKGGSVQRSPGLTSSNHLPGLLLCLRFFAYQDYCGMSVSK
jgi:hypothetical protein